MIKIIIFLALIISFSTAFAQIDNQAKNKQNNDFLDGFEEIYGFQSDFLVPTESLLHSEPYSIKYNSKLKEILFKGLPDYFDVQYFSTPSFDAERVLVIRKGKIFYHIAKQSIWGTYYKEITDRTDTIKIKTDKIEVDRFTNKISESSIQPSFIFRLRNILMPSSQYA